MGFGPRSPGGSSLPHSPGFRTRGLLGPPGLPRRGGPLGSEGGACPLLPEGPPCPTVCLGVAVDLSGGPPPGCSARSPPFSGRRPRAAPAQAAASGCWARACGGGSGPSPGRAVRRLLRSSRTAARLERLLSGQEPRRSTGLGPCVLGSAPSPAPTERASLSSRRPSPPRGAESLGRSSWAVPRELRSLALARARSALLLPSGRLNGASARRRRFHVARSTLFCYSCCRATARGQALSQRDCSAERCLSDANPKAPASPPRASLFFFHRGGGERRGRGGVRGG